MHCTYPPQADCPEDVAAYIHRVGRTARYTHAGRGLLLLLPSEREGMLKQVRRAGGDAWQLASERGRGWTAAMPAWGGAWRSQPPTRPPANTHPLTCPRMQLEDARVPIKQAHHNPAKVQPIGPALQALLSKDTELKVGGC